MSHPPRKATSAELSRVRLGTLPIDLYDYLHVELRPRVGRQVQHDPREWRVTDNLPEPVPVTSPEIDAFEAWFGDIFDQLFGDRP